MINTYTFSFVLSKNWIYLVRNKTPQTEHGPSPEARANKLLSQPSYHAALSPPPGTLAVTGLSLASYRQPSLFPLGRLASVRLSEPYCQNVFQSLWMAKAAKWESYSSQYGNQWVHGEPHGSNGIKPLPRLFSKRDARKKKKGRSTKFKGPFKRILLV